MTVFVVMMNGHIQRVFDKWDAAKIYTDSFDLKDDYMIIVECPVYEAEDLPALTS